MLSVFGSSRFDLCGAAARCVNNLIRQSRRREEGFKTMHVRRRRGNVIMHGSVGDRVVTFEALLCRVLPLNDLCLSTLLQIKLWMDIDY